MRHPDEGTIHAWLDGALDERESAELEAHVAACAGCAAAVAEARGLIAGASRVLSALDDVPSGVIPAAPSAEPAVPTEIPGVVPLRRGEGSVTPRRRFRVTPAWMAAAAVLVVTVGTLVMSRSGARRMDRVEESVARDMRAAAAPEPPAADSVAGFGAPAGAAATDQASAPATANAPKAAADSTSVARSRIAVSQQVAGAAPVPSALPAPAPVAAAEMQRRVEGRGEIAGRVADAAPQKRAALMNTAPERRAAAGAAGAVAADAAGTDFMALSAVAGCYEIVPDTARAALRAEAVERAPAAAPSKAAAPAAAAIPTRFVLDTVASTLSPNARAVVAPLEGGAVRGFWVQFAPDSMRIVWTSRERPSLIVTTGPSGVRGTTGSGESVLLRRCR